jgi:DNA primase
MKTDGLTFPEAVRVLAERAGIDVIESATDASVREANAARKAKDDLYAVNHLAATYYERALWGGPGASPHPLAHHARGELSRRGMVLPEEGASEPASEEAIGWRDTVQAFRIGYAPPSWDGLATFLRQQGVSASAAEKVGLLVQRQSGSGHYDRFRQRLMFSVIDVLGRVVAFSGRALPEPSRDELSSMGMSPRESDPPAKYINSPESPVYLKGEHLFGLHQARHAIRQGGRAILVEGNFDVVSLHARGIRNVLAPLGTAFTTAQAKLLKRFAPEVVVLFDGDAAGRKATRAARGPCREGGLSARVGVLPPKVDPDDLVRERGAAALERIVQSSRGMLEHLIDDALDNEEFGGATLTEQLARVRAVAKLLAEEDDPGLRGMAKTYADRVSSKLVVLNGAPADLRQLEQAMERAVSGGGSGGSGQQSGPAPVPHDRARSRAQVEEMAHAVLGAILDYPELVDDTEVESALGVLEGDVALAVAAVRQTRVGQKGIYTAEFLAQIAAPIHHFAAGRLASPVFESSAEARVELLNNAGKLRRLHLKRENAAVVEQLHRSRAHGDAAEEDALLREVERRTREKLGLV